MKHREKLRMARRMMTRNERKKHVSPFQSQAWELRKENRETRVQNKIIMAQAKKEEKLKVNKSI